MRAGDALHGPGQRSGSIRPTRATQALLIAGADVVAGLRLQYLQWQWLVAVLPGQQAMHSGLRFSHVVLHFVNFWDMEKANPSIRHSGECEGSGRRADFQATARAIWSAP